MKKIILSTILIMLLVATVFSVATDKSNTIQVSEYYTNPSPLQPGTENAYLQVTVINTGESTIENAKFRVDFADGFSSLQDTYEVKKMEKSGRYTAIFKFDIGEDITPGSYHVSMDILYNDVSRGAITTTKVLQLGVATEQRFEIIKLDNSIESGVTDTISFNLKNSGTFTLSDIYVDLTSDVDFVSPTNRFYINQLLQGESKKVTFDLFVDRDTDPGVHSLTINVDSAQYDLTENVGLLVTGKPYLQIAGISTDDTAFLGKEISMSVQLENMGTGKARSVNAKLKNGFFGSTESFVGTIDSDDTESAIFDVTPYTLGFHDIEIDVVYLDNHMNEYHQTLRASTNVKFDFGPIITLVIVIAVGYGLYYGYNHRRELLKKLKKML